MQVRYLSILAATVAVSATAVAFAQGPGVQAQQDGTGIVPIFLEIEGVKGETSPPPPPPPPPQAPPAQRGVQAPDDPQGMLLPAIQKAQDPPQEAGEERPRRRGGLSLSIGGVTVGNGGVNVAVGDVNGDARPSSRDASSSSRQSAPPPPPRRR